MPKVSVIVPIYNVADYIERCAKSLFSQTLKEIEFIFVDDCSSDDSVLRLEKVISQYPECQRDVKIIRHTKNRGLTSARNSGLSIATGEYIAYCDSDDYVHSDMYKLLYERATETQSDVVICDFYFSLPNNILHEQKTIAITNKLDTIKNYIAYGWTVVWNMIVKKSLYDKHNLRSPEYVTYCEDFFLTIRQLVYAEKIAKVDMPLYYYNRANVSSIMHNLNHSSMLDEKRVYLETIELFRDLGVATDYEKEMSWRVLKNKQDLILNPETHNEFLSIYPVSHKYIVSCPSSFCNNKIKLMMWLLTHSCRYILLFILYIRNCLK